MSTYTKDSENIYFLNDKNITSSLIDDSVLSNAIPSHELFKDTYDGLSTYDNNLCIEVDGLNTKTNAISSNLCSEVKNLSDLLSIDLSNEISSRIKAVQDLSTSLSCDINSLSDRLSIEINSLSTSLSNTADEKFVLKSGDLIETLSVAGKTELYSDIVVPNHNAKITIGNAVAPHKGMFVWNGKDKEYIGKEVDPDVGNTFSINPNHELCGVFIGDKSLCAYITEDVALTATNIRGEINTVSSLLTGNYALSSDVSAAFKLVNDAGYLVSNDFDFKYDSTSKAIWLSAGSKSISVDATDFIKDGLLHNAEIKPGTKADSTLTTYYLVLTFNTYDENNNLIVTTQSVDLENIIDVYKADGPGIELIGNNTFKLDFDVVAETAILNKLSGEVKDISANHETRLTTISDDLDIAENEITNLTAHTKSLQEYATSLSAENGGIIANINNDIAQLRDDHNKDVADFNDKVKNNATFAGVLKITRGSDIFNNGYLSAFLFEQNSSAHRKLKNGDIYEVIFDEGENSNLFDKSNPFDCAKSYITTKDNIRLAHKDYIVIYTPNIGEEITYDNVHIYTKIIPAVRFYELYQLSVTVSSDYFWLSGGNNNENNHAISGNNYFKDVNYFEGISASLISADSLSASLISADSLSASLISADSLSASKLSAHNMSVDNLSARNISVDWKNVKHSDNGYSLYDLSVDLSNKIFIKNELTSDGKTADLSIIKISKDEYDEQVASTTLLSDNVLYVVEADYIDAYGQVISNLVMTDNKNPSEATNKHYVDSLCASLSNTVVLSVENLQAQIISNDNDIEYLSGQHDWLSDSLSTDLSNEISSRIEAIQDLSDSLSIDLSNEISSRIEAIQDLSDNLSTDLCALSTDVYDILSINISTLSVLSAPSDITFDTIELDDIRTHLSVLYTATYNLFEKLSNYNIN